MAEEYRDKVVVLAWHVDYWDSLGWKDPFADKAYTTRQRAYIKRLGTRSLVTPQILVGNARTTNEWSKKIKEEGEKPARLKITTELKVADGKLTAKIGLAETPEDLPPTAVVRAVLFQKKAVTEVTTGENAGKTLTEYFVVRKLCDPIAAVKAIREPQKVTLKLPEGVEKDNLGLAVLVEDSKKMETIEAAVFDLP